MEMLKILILHPIKIEILMRRDHLFLFDGYYTHFLTTWSELVPVELTSFSASVNNNSVVIKLDYSNRAK